MPPRPVAGGLAPARRLRRLRYRRGHAPGGQGVRPERPARSAGNWNCLRTACWHCSAYRPLRHPGRRLVGGGAGERVVTSSSPPVRTRPADRDGDAFTTLDEGAMGGPRPSPSRDPRCRGGRGRHEARLRDDCGVRRQRTPRCSTRHAAGSRSTTSSSPVLPALARAAFIGHADLFAGRWRAHLDRLLAQRRPRSACRERRAGRGRRARSAPRVTKAPAGRSSGVQSLVQVTSDQMRGMLTFSIETGSRSACARNAGRSRSALNPM